MWVKHNDLRVNLDNVKSFYPSSDYKIIGYDRKDKDIAKYKCMHTIIFRMIDNTNMQFEYDKEEDRDCMIILIDDDLSEYYAVIEI